jgi:hypothetical protein
MWASDVDGGFERLEGRWRYFKVARWQGFEFEEDSLTFVLDVNPVSREVSLVAALIKVILLPIHHYPSCYSYCSPSV